MKTKRYIPVGGAFQIATERVLTRSQVTAAVQRYARKHGYYARTVRGMTVLFRAAIAEYQA